LPKDESRVAVTWLEKVDGQDLMYYEGAPEDIVVDDGEITGGLVRDAILQKVELKDDTDEDGEPTGEFVLPDSTRRSIQAIMLGKRDQQQQAQASQPAYPSSISSLKVVDLKKALRLAKLPVSGKKAELQARLHAHHTRAVPSERAGASQATANNPDPIPPASDAPTADDQHSDSGTEASSASVNSGDGNDSDEGSESGSESDNVSDDDSGDVARASPLVPMSDAFKTGVHLIGRKCLRTLGDECVGQITQYDEQKEAYTVQFQDGEIKVWSLSEFEANAVLMVGKNRLQRRERAVCDIEELREFWSDIVTTCAEQRKRSVANRPRYVAEKPLDIMVSAIGLGTMDTMTMQTMAGQNGSGVAAQHRVEFLTHVQRALQSDLVKPTPPTIDSNMAKAGLNAVREQLQAEITAATSA